MDFKIVILLVNIRFISLPKVIKKMESTPPPPNKKKKKIIILWKTSYFENFTMYRKTQERFWGSNIYPNHFQKQKRKSDVSFRSWIQIYKKGVLPQNAKTMSYD